VDELLPDKLRTLWRSVQQKKLATEAFMTEQQRLLAEHRRHWADALLLPDKDDLQQSLFTELGLYTRCADLDEIQNRCTASVRELAEEWRENVDATDRQSVEEFYDRSEKEIYDLIWWHTLSEDLSPLAYVTALQFARREGCRSCLDFGAGVGSGGIVFVRNGLTIALADISSPLLAFSQWRFQLRGLPAQFFDLKSSALPSEAFDIVTAMDVFEHLVDPVDAVETLSRVVRPGGFIFGRFHADEDDERPLHIMHDFEATFRRLRDLGFRPVWEDEWLWGHQAFQKR
jgi:SAM-dependent methyltransferase